MNFMLSLLLNKYVIGGILIVTLLGGLYFKYNSMVNELQELREAKKANEMVIAQQKETIKEVQKNYEAILGSKEELQNAFRK